MMPGISDHSPVVLSLHEKTHIKGTFRYYNYWTKMLGFFQTMKYARDIKICGTPLFTVV